MIIPTEAKKIFESESLTVWDARSSRQLTVADVPPSGRFTWRGGQRARRVPVTMGCRYPYQVYVVFSDLAIDTVDAESCVESIEGVEAQPLLALDDLACGRTYAREEYGSWDAGMAMTWLGTKEVTGYDDGAIHYRGDGWISCDISHDGRTVVLIDGEE